MMKPVQTVSLLLAGAAAIAATTLAHGGQPAAAKPARAAACSTGGLSLPAGFCATIFADKVGHARHMTVAPDGTVYVNAWSGPYYRNSAAPTGGFVYALKDTDGDGKADSIQRFGATAEEGNKGGTGIILRGSQLYVETNDRIVRFTLPRGGVPTAPPETILSDMPLSGDHPMHGFVIDPKGNLFVNMGSATNACEEHNRQPGSKGLEPCIELETRAGIWRYSADRTDQKFSSADRYATGIRNTGGLSLDAGGRLYAVQHGRDQLSQNWPALYRPEQGAELPAEELIEVVQGGDYGWPRCYYDGFQKKLVLAPDHGGDGGKTVGLCAAKRPPVAAFPAHWGPNDLLIYRGGQFPAAYRGGAFIAFHGSWNRAPGPQDGYLVAFQPLANGKASGKYIRFADGFAGEHKEPGRAMHRPSGLAAGPDGALYISDDQNGRIWRVTYRGAATAALANAPVAAIGAVPAAGGAMTLTPPPGFTAEQVALGERIYRGQAKSGTCSGCHGSDARGSSVGPKLTGPDYLWGDGSVAALAKSIREGVLQPRKYGGAMPAKGGAPLDGKDVDAVAAYLWALAHQSR